MSAILAGHGEMQVGDDIIAVPEGSADTINHGDISDDENVPDKVIWNSTAA